MNVADRITDAPACKVITLSEAEKDLYRGSGWRIAHFVDGTLTALHDPSDIATDDAHKAVRDVLAKMEGDGEWWLVMCSCYELCEPRRIDKTSALDIAHLARIIGESLS